MTPWPNTPTNPLQQGKRRSLPSAKGRHKAAHRFLFRFLAARQPAFRLGFPANIV
jgi:hypothetical protein